MSGPTPHTHHLQAVAAPNDGWKMLLKKEVLRFWRVAFQTIAAPVLTSVLYLLIFGHVMSDRVQVYPGISYVAFLAPGLVMMSVLQNAFANSASSLVQSKIMGNLVFTLLTPLSAWHWFVAYVGAAVARALLVGLGVYLVTLLYMPPRAVAPLWIAVFALLGAGLMGGCAGPAGRAVVGQVRPDGDLPELHRHADDLPGRRVLFDPLAARHLAAAEPFQPVLLHDRRFPLWLSWGVRRVALAQPGGGGRQLRGAVGAGAVPVENRL